MRSQSVLVRRYLGAHPRRLGKPRGQPGIGEPDRGRRRDQQQRHGTAQPPATGKVGPVFHISGCVFVVVHEPPAPAPAGAFAV